MSAIKVNVLLFAFGLQWRPTFSQFFCHRQQEKEKKRRIELIDNFIFSTPARPDVQQYTNGLFYS